jgi:DNA-binding NarL/FixJ family response regulator
VTRLCGSATLFDLDQRSSGAPGSGRPAKAEDQAKRGGPVAPAADELRLVVADDQVAIRAGIKRAIEAHGMRVVAEASNADEAVRVSLAQRPDVCILAVDLPGGGVAVARMIKQSLPETRIVMMTGTARDEDLFEALRAGADGYLLMSTPASRLPHAILGVTRGEAALPRAMTGRLVLEFRERGARRRVIVRPAREEVELTAREFEVLEHLRRREATSEIASHLGISQVTVRRHLASVLRKLGAPNRRRAIEMLDQADQHDLETD